MTVGGADRETEHDGEFFPLLPHRLLGGFDSLTGILHVEDGFDEQGIHAAVDERIYLFAISYFQRILVEGRFFARAHTRGLVGRTDAAQDIAGLIVRGESIGSLASQLTGCEIDVAHMVLQSVAGQ